ncbi:hypothetical protein MUG91_G80n22 [Manis pentadactyla]|nr:hypothetical protein MUG91_G80n22 [Manis pentadactyla]
MDVRNSVLYLDRVREKDRSTILEGEGEEEEEEEEKEEEKEKEGTRGIAESTSLEKNTMASLDVREAASAE